MLIIAVTSTCHVSRVKAYQAICPCIFRRRAQGKEPGNEARRWVGSPKGCKQYGSGIESYCRRAISVNGLRNKLPCLVGPPFQVFMVSFSATAGWHFLGDLIASLLIGGCG